MRVQDLNLQQRNTAAPFAKQLEKFARFILIFQQSLKIRLHRAQLRILAGKSQDIVLDDDLGRLLCGALFALQRTQQRLGDVLTYVPNTHKQSDSVG